ncbi:unnamed protein product [Cylindrotheca closterium]|uniref:SGF29 C-terminal domain-containing protein n=1 Tax=Cylindrotheca closterium TaxID=2856 RepID=A0AAD2CTX1_9STRA|nr:unnamed protein product [Cylindrotheca closterium]
MPNTNRPPTGQSIQDLMAQRYPQPNRARNPHFPPQHPPAYQQPPQQMNMPNQQYQPTQGVSYTNPPVNPQVPNRLSPYGSPPQASHPPPAGGMSGPPTTFPNPTPKPAQSKASTTKKIDKNIATGPSGFPYNTDEQNKLLSYCEWKDKVLWASRMILGGNSVNGFLRATAAAQRIKKQRARQSAQARKTAAAAASTGGNAEAAADADKKAKPVFDQVEEEKLKKDIMNPRTAKKIKSELEAGMEYCTSLHNVLRSVLYEVDPSMSQYFPAPLDKPALVPTLPTPQQPTVPHDSSIPWALNSKTAPKQRPAPAAPSASSAASSAQNVGSSTLRRSRRKKLPPSKEPPVNLPEFDSFGKRVCAKKEHSIRVFEVLRFRSLKAGDFVAARLSSRDLWILAKVLKDYSGFTMAPVEFVKLSGARRDAVFKEKVMVRDVEEKEDGGSTLVSRNLVLPLPRTYSEAAEWGQRCKKGSRVYAMYPQTTSLYPATVIDSTTYCRNDDDIIVVEFDGEEQDPTGKVPQYHIPARFVTLIPREFPASQESSSKQNKVKTQAKNESDPFTSSGFGGLDALGDIDSIELDLDAPLEGGEEGMDFPMF